MRAWHVGDGTYRGAYAGWAYQQAAHKAWAWYGSARSGSIAPGALQAVERGSLQIYGEPPALAVAALPDR